MFGYPSGIGALLVRTDRTHLLKKSYFGGGTVKVVVPDAMEVHPRDHFVE
ncbi:unnamed protein product, partial [Gongylonema pulchrum]|uniref:GCV_T domain-containing protein n=1 Tax=Gongylonema pulchrum TaxID=637853 RepID=A0A183DI14_9BILA